MDLSFDIMNSEGDHIMIALSYYDAETVSLFYSDPLTLALVFYDVTLVRKSGEGYVDYKILHTVSDILARFMSENEDVVLCFYCDTATDVLRNHRGLLPQEYRSQLFSRMYDKYIDSHNISDYVNHRVEIVDNDNKRNIRIAHFICRREHQNAVAALGKMLMCK